MNKQEILKNIFGYDEFRKGQAEVIDSLINYKDCLAIMPTGAGKSICYQVPAIIKDGVTIVISPLISLMDDQVRQLKDSGVSCAFLNSSLSITEFRNTLVEAYKGQYKLIYVAPERLTNETFVKFSNSVKIEMVIIDESHCISQWGPDFRPSYLKISEYMKGLNQRPVIGAFTATATKTVKEDIISALSLLSPTIVSTGYNRKNLYFAVEIGTNKQARVLNYLSKNKNKSGIIYASTRAEVEDLCEMLCQNNINATRYHAALSDDEKKQNHHDFIYDRKTIMVATNAFGMGINKSNVNFVIHFNMPRDIEAYYQEAGRAGRDGTDAECILYYSGADYRTQMYFINNADNKNEYDRETLNGLKENRIVKLNAMVGYCKTKDCLRHYLLNYFGEATSNNCESCSNCEAEFETIEIQEEAKKIIQCVIEICKKFPLGEAMVVDTLRGSKNQKVEKYNLSINPMFASLSNYSSEQVKRIINQLYEEEYLMKTVSEFPTVKATKLGIEFLNSKEPCLMKVLKQTVQEKKITEQAQIYNIDLFYKLKEIRLRIANEKGIPAFIVFTDKTLKDMAEKSPKTPKEFLNVSGVGQHKYEQYGESFLEVINQYYETNKKQ